MAGRAGRKLGRECRGLLPPGRGSRSTSARLANGRSVLQKDVAHRQAQRRRLGHQHCAGISSGIHARLRRILRTAARHTARHAVQRHSGFGCGTLRNRHLGQPMVPARCRRYRRHLRAESVRELHHCGVGCSSRLRCRSARAVGYSSLADHRRSAISAAFHRSGVQPGPDFADTRRKASRRKQRRWSGLESRTSSGKNRD